MDMDTAVVNETVEAQQQYVMGLMDVVMLAGARGNADGWVRAIEDDVDGGDNDDGVTPFDPSRHDPSSAASQHYIDTGERLHQRDEDCDVDEATGCCCECGVEHGEPCESCGGSGFHIEGCAYIVRPSRGEVQL